VLASPEQTSRTAAAEVVITLEGDAEANIGEFTLLCGGTTTFLLQLSKHHL